MGRIPTRDKNNENLLKQEKTVGCLKSTCKQFTKQFSFNNNELEIVATSDYEAKNNLTDLLDCQSC
jgi:hypothetical protein